MKLISNRFDPALRKFVFIMNTLPYRHERCYRRGLLQLTPWRSALLNTFTHFYALNLLSNILPSSKSHKKQTVIIYRYNLKVIKLAISLILSISNWQSLYFKFLHAHARAGWHRPYAATCSDGYLTCLYNYVYLMAHFLMVLYVSFILINI